MSNVTIKVRPVRIGSFCGNAIGFNGSEYRCRFDGIVFRATTLSSLKFLLTDYFMAWFMI